MKTVCRGFTYNHACYILEMRKDKYPVTDTKQFGQWTGFYDKDGRLLARYHEGTGKLQVAD